MDQTQPAVHHSVILSCHFLAGQCSAADLSHDAYAIMFRKGDVQLTKLINDTFHQLAENRDIERRCNR
jgi:ABC-type amino acid transport substrate-binding protein